MQLDEWRSSIRTNRSACWPDVQSKVRRESSQHRLLFFFSSFSPSFPLPLSMRWCRLIEKQMWLWYIHPYCIKIDWPTNFGSTGVPVAQRVCCAILKNQFSEIKQKQKCGQCNAHYVQCMCVAIPSWATRICSLFMFVQFSWVCFGSIPLCSVLFIFFLFISSQK